MNILKITELTKVYEGKLSYTAVNNVSMNVDKSDFIAIMGPSGSGKTTLLNMISTIDKPTTGKILINGNDPHELNDDALAEFRRKTLGFIFQDFNLINTLTVSENIMLPLTFDGIPVEEMRKRVEDLAHMLGINKLLNKRTYEISGGQAQRIAIARAVIANPVLILADEPTGNLDSKASKDVMDLFLHLNEKIGATILMVTHDSFVASYCKKVLILKDGKFYRQIECEDNRMTFHQKIVRAMNELEGEHSDHS